MTVTVIRDGVWVDELGIVHCDCRRLLKAMGLTPSVANQLWLREQIKRAARTENPKVVVLPDEITLE
jgi:hypothetical protein